MIGALLSLVKPKSVGEIVQSSLGDYSEKVIRGLRLETDNAAAARSFFSSGNIEDINTFDQTEKAVLGHVREQFHKAGTMYSDEAISAMQSNYKATNNLFGGLSSAKETTSGNLLLKSAQEGGLMGLGLGALLGAGGAAVTGGDAGEGAMIGGLVGFGAGSVARALTRSAGDIEDSMMKRLLGNKYDELKQGTPHTGEISEDMRIAAAEKQLKHGEELDYGYDIAYRFPREDLEKSGLPEDSYINDEDSIMSSVLPEIDDFNSIFVTKGEKKRIIEVKELDLKNGNLMGDELRQARLDTIKNMGDDELNKISGGRSMQKRLTSNKEDSLLTQSRTLTMAGAFLGGVAFTPKKKDHRRGFNKNRGNRI